MKTKLLSVLFVLISGFMLAQKNQEKSEEFEEFNGWTKLVQLRNGNTGLLELTDKEGMNFYMFNAQHKKISGGKLNLPKMGDKIKYYQMEGVYDISGDFVFFMTGGEDGNAKKPVFFRVIIDGASGKLKSEEIIGKLDELTMGAAYGMYFGDTDIPSFVVEKDPDSDYYAIIKYNTIAPETKDRIEITHYGPDHKAINKANYNTPTDKYKFTKFLSAYVHGADYVLISTCAFNTKKSGGEEIRFYVAQLNKGKTTFIQKEMQYTEYTKNAKTWFTYNKPKGIVNMLLWNANGVFYQNINPTSMALDQPYAPDLTSLNNFYKTQMGNKKDFGGVMEGSFVDKNGNITYLYQQLTKNMASAGMGMPETVESCVFGDVALITMSPEGKVVSTTAFPLAIFRKGDHEFMQYNSAKKGRKVNGGFTPVADNDWYYGIDFITTENGCYLLFNNTIANMEKPDDKNAGRITGISGTTGVIYSYKGGKLTKDYLLGAPANKKEAKFINPGSSDYNAATKTYATVVTSPKDKKCYVMWTKID